MKSVVSGIAGSVRLKQLTRAGITIAERHGKRLDETGKARGINDTPALTRSGLDLNALYDAHVDGVFVPKAKTKAHHVILQFPKELVDPDDADGMLDHARAFCERVFGSDAIFGDRIDRDERNRQVVDVFVVPKYLKRTAKSEKVAVSMTRHLKKLAEKHGHPPIPFGIGRAMQDELFEYFREVMKLEGVQRGAKKAFAGPDWKSAEQQRVEELEGKARELESRERELEEKAQKLERDHAGVDESKLMLAERTAELDARWLDLQSKQDALDGERARVLSEAENAKRRLLAEGAELKLAAIKAGETEKSRLQGEGEAAKQNALLEGENAARKLTDEAARSRDRAAADEDAAARKSREADEDYARATEAREKADADRAKARQLRDSVEENLREARQNAEVARRERAKVKVDTARMELLSRVVDPEDELQAWVRDGKIVVKGNLSEAEKMVIKIGYGETEPMWKAIVSKLVSMDVREWHLGEDEKELSQAKETVQALHTKLTDAWEKIQGALVKAKSFLAAWRSIPAADRTPTMQRAVTQASDLTATSLAGLTPEDLPPGFTLPGKGGQGVVD